MAHVKSNALYVGLLISTNKKCHLNYKIQRKYLRTKCEIFEQKLIFNCPSHNCVAIKTKGYIHNSELFFDDNYKAIWYDLIRVTIIIP